MPQTATSQAKPQANSEETNLRYSGEFFDKDLKQQYLRARYYNQNNGQFNRLDPYSGDLANPQSLHKYAYCHQDPVNHIDPSGNFSLVEVAAVSTIIGVLTGMHHYYNWTHKMSAWNSVIFAFFTTVTVALSIIFAPVIASAMSGIILSGGVLLEISALIMIPLAINYGGTLLEAVDIIFDSKKSVMERISAIGYLVAQLVTFWSASKASKGISKSATKSTGAPKTEIKWDSWQGYKKVKVNGREYAKVGDRLYTRHAVDRMQPSGLGTPAGQVGAGRSIAPGYIDDVIRTGSKTPIKVNGVNRIIHRSGSVEVITEGNKVITVNPFKG